MLSAFSVFAHERPGDSYLLLMSMVTKYVFGHWQMSSRGQNYPGSTAAQLRTSDWLVTTSVSFLGPALHRQWVTVHGLLSLLPMFAIGPGRPWSCERS